MSARTVGFLAILSLVAAFANPINNATKVIERDIIILGGGASGSHIAVRLREDLNKTIVVVEKKTHLVSDAGGHVSTYDDPETGKPYDVGVYSYTDYPGAREFVEGLGISIQDPVRLPLNTTYANFNNGKLVNYSAPTYNATQAALARYLTLCEKYEEFLLPSYAKFPTSGVDIPEDLTLSFADFVQKHQLEAAVLRIFQVTGLGMGNLGDQTTLYVMQAFGAPITRSLLGTIGSFVPVSLRNQDIYDAIAELLGDDVLYSSTAVKATRTDEGVEVLVKGANNTRTLIRAKKLIISFEPTLDNLNGIDLDEQETSVFEKWKRSTVYAGVVSHPSLHDGSAYTNINPTNWLSLPRAPFVDGFSSLGAGNFRVLVSAEGNLDSCEAQKLVTKSFKQLSAAGTLASLDSQRPNLKYFVNHGAMHLRVDPSELKAGFIAKLYALQGRRSTFFTGGAWTAQFSTIVWAFNNQFVLPMLLAGF
ncbi:beta-cyclopiazonate dehydrogenase [Colletotrichum liriopes]|uniref:Beta-cyclopiazonate dehydrogenase n=1 Tax=Colletotrichum liriopes TaxID=708192 RepID=A0AA37H2G3_9PEZI|nr:beta-cyclopiazonate dehydrogenase [Colletotrichum liriopes]